MLHQLYAVYSQPDSDDARIDLFCVEAFHRTHERWFAFSFAR